MAAALTNKIVVREWAMFDKIQNCGGRASCQDNFEVFNIMRSSQFNAWDIDTRKSYLEDLIRAENTGRNLLAEKYAYMSGYPYCGSFDEKEEKSSVIAPIVQKLAEDTVNLHTQFPRLARQGRPLHKDGSDTVPIDAYFEKELFTYSLHTLLSLGKYMEELSKEGKSLSRMILENTVRMYGYESLGAAEAALSDNNTSNAESSMKQGADTRSNSILTARKKTVVLIVLLGMVTPFSTDMCLPALPTISSEFAIPVPQANLIIILFFVFMAISMLVCGPFSDKLGRKRVLVPCILLFVTANLICGLSQHFALLVLARILTALGAGGMVTISTAMIKDVFSGRSREKMLALNQVFGVLAPIIAPVVGAEMLVLFSWNASFFALAVIGVVTLLFAIPRQDTLDAEHRVPERVSRSILKLLVVLKNKGFCILVLIGGIASSSFMAYLGTVSYIFIDHFGLSAQEYSFFFAAASLCTAAGSLIFIKASEQLTPRKMIGPCFCVVGACGILIASVGHISPLLFFLCFVCSPIASSVNRPMMTALLLKQHEGDTGTLASLINFCFTIIGAISMLAASAGWSDYILALGIVTLSCALIAGIGWFLLQRSSIRVEGLDDIEAPR